MAYTGPSIVDYLKSIGQPSDINSRIALGKQHGIDYSKSTTNYATENTLLLGILNKPVTIPTPAPTPTPTPIPTPTPATTPQTTVQGGVSQEGDTRINPTTGVKEMFDPTGTWVPLTSDMQPSGQEKPAPWQATIPPEAIDTKTGLINTTEGPKSLKDITTPGGILKPGWDGKIIPSPGGKELPGGVLGDLGAGAGAGAVVTSDQPREAETKKTAEQIKADMEEAAKDQAEIEKLQRQKVLQQLKTELGITDTTLPAKPVATSLATDFEALRSKEGVTALETQINSIDTEIAATESGMRAEIEKELGRLAPTENIGLRQIDIQKKYQDQLDSLNRRKSTLVSELNTKNTLISNIMQFKQTDYANASAAYQTAFSQNVSLINAVEGRMTAEDQQISQVKDDARANLNVITNMVTESGGNWSTLSPTLQNKVIELEMKAGLPSGVTETFMTVMPGMKVDYTTAGYDVAGNQVVSFFSYNNGDPKLIKSITSPAVNKATEKEPTKPTETETRRTATQQYAVFMQPKLGADGYISPTDYRTAKLGWVNETGYSAEDFDKAFAHLRNPKQPYGEYGIKE